MSLFSVFDRRPHVVIVQHAGLNGSTEWRKLSERQMSKVEAERIVQEREGFQSGMVRARYQAIALDEWEARQEQ